MIGRQFPDLIERGQQLTGYLSIAFAVLVIALVGSLLLFAVSRWVAVVTGRIAPMSE
jgi:hypothetical protein